MNIIYRALKNSKRNFQHFRVGNYRWDEFFTDFKVAESADFRRQFSQLGSKGLDLNSNVIFSATFEVYISLKHFVKQESKKT